MIQDLRYTVRTLRKRPGFTLVVVFTLGLGIGAVTVVLDLFNLIAWRRLPAERPQDLVGIYTASPQAFNGPYGRTSFPDYEDYRDDATSLDGLAAYHSSTVSLDTGDATETVEAWAVTGDYFEVLGTRAALGRVLARADDEPGRPPVAVLTHALWRRLGADPDVLGRTVRLAGVAFTVVGLGPETFRGTMAGVPCDVFFPSHLSPQVFDPNTLWLTDRSLQRWSLVGRLAPGSGRGQTRAELDVQARRLDREHPVPEFERRLSVVPARVTDPIDLRNLGPTMRLLTVAVALLLAIACANVADLLLSRAAARRREMGLRQSLGADRLRLVRQLLTESLLLALAGGLWGLCLAFWMRNLLAVYFGAEFVGEMRFDHRVLGLALLACLLTTLLFGLAPALVTSRINLVAALKDSAADDGGRRRFSAGQLLAAAQVALSLVLLASTGLLVKTLWQQRGAEIGFTSDNLLLAWIDISPGRYSAEDGRAFFHRLRAEAAAMPGVSSAGLTLLVPPIMLDVTTRFRLGEDLETLRTSRLNYADGPYFQTVGLRLHQGRLFEPGDAASEHGVVLVNRQLASELWPGEDAVGRRIRVERVRPGDPGNEYEVVGVVGDVTQHDLSRRAEGVLYFSWDQRYRSSLRLVLRAEGDPETTFATLRERLHALDPSLALDMTRTHAEHQWEALVEKRLQTHTVAVFGIAGLVLAVLGVFGVLSYTVSRQVREIGIRMAIGARANDVLFWVLRRGMALAAVGVGLGLVGSLAAIRFLQGFLSGVEGHDPAVLAVAAAVLVLAAAGAVYLPARRAARTDPIVALRDE